MKPQVAVLIASSFVMMVSFQNCTPTNIVANSNKAPQGSDSTTKADTNSGGTPDTQTTKPTDSTPSQGDQKDKTNTGTVHNPPEIPVNPDPKPIVDDKPDTHHKPSPGDDFNSGTDLNPPLPPITPVQIDCAPTVQTVTTNLRILFMVDNSGSTNQTDPHQYFRNQVIKSFLQQYGSKTNLTYSFGFFAGTQAYLYDTQKQSFQSKLNQPFGTAADLTRALDTFDRLKPGGNTPYHAAFKLLQGAILADLGSNSETTSYSIVFMSDGRPTDVSAQPRLSVQMSGLVQKMEKAVQAAGGLVSLSTVYFGPAQNRGDSGLLQTMSNVGKGDFVDTNSNPNLVISDVITVPGQDCQPRGN